MSIEGTWYNERGSTMTLQIQDIEINGQLQFLLCGTYTTAVGRVLPVPFPLIGTFHLNIETNAVTFGFVVAWGSVNATTSWSGQYQDLGGGMELMSTMWLLTEETDVGEDWRQATIGKDVWTREPHRND